MKPLVVTFWTNEAYKGFADRMMASARAVGLETKGYFVDNTAGTWVSGANAKPGVILAAMKEFPDQDILFVDADCRFLSYPVLVDGSTHDQDIATTFDDIGKPSSCVVWLRAGGGRRYAERWVTEMAKVPGRLDDHVALGNTMRDLKPHSILHLPPSYAWVEEWLRKRFGGAVPVIEHFAVGEHKTLDLDWQKTKWTFFKDDRG